MNRKLLFLAVTGAWMLVNAASVGADIRPQPSPPKDGKVLFSTRMTVVPDTTTYEARLQISDETFRSLRAALEQNQNGQQSASYLTQRSTRTVMAGVFLTLSFSFAGIWLVRSGASRNQRFLAAAFLVAGAFSAAAMIAKANVAPPSAFRWRSLPQNIIQGRETEGSITIEIVPDEHGMRLIMPRTPTNTRKSGEE